jgi:hypothetical protein
LPDIAAGGPGGDGEGYRHVTITVGPSPAGGLFVEPTAADRAGGQVVSVHPAAGATTLHVSSFSYGPRAPQRHRGLGPALPMARFVDVIRREAQRQT